MKHSYVFEKTAAMLENDLFYKAYRYTRGDSMQKEHIFPYFREIEGYTLDDVPIIQGKKFVMAGANNYLSLTLDNRIKDAMREVIKKYGSGCSGSRYLNGTLNIHTQLERDLANFMEKEACILFSTGYQANEGTIQCLTTKGDIIFSDKDNHASIVMGTMLSPATSIRFKHNSMEHLECLISKSNPKSPKLIASDGVFSMSGRLANIPKLLEIAKKYNARLFIDDAHAIGVLGSKGQGSASVYGLLDQVDIISGTFSKSFASLGGFVVGEKKVIDYIRKTCPSHIFSASMPPSAVAAAQKALEIIIEEPYRLKKVRQIGKYMSEQIKSMGFQVLKTDTPITTFVIGDDHACAKFWKSMFNRCIFVNAVMPPAIQKGRAAIRTSYMTNHTDDDLQKILKAIYEVGIEEKIIEQP